MLTQEDIDVVAADGSNKELADYYRRQNVELLRLYPDGVRPSWVSAELAINDYRARCAEGKDVR